LHTFMFFLSPTLETIPTPSGGIKSISQHKQSSLKGTPEQLLREENLLHFGSPAKWVCG
jgi:hypothetical protein